MKIVLLQKKRVENILLIYGWCRRMAKKMKRKGRKKYSDTYDGNSTFCGIFNSLNCFLLFLLVFSFFWWSICCGNILYCCLLLNNNFLFLPSKKAIKFQNFFNFYIITNCFSFSCVANLLKINYRNEKEY